jgi:signal transduction histidine kinase/ligand-binding sensor domain-containing protein
VKRTGNIIRQLFLSCICLLCTHTLEAQQRQYIRHILPEDGLVSRSILNAIHQRDGRVWIGTSTGLQLYDGHHFYSIEELSQQSLPELRTIAKMQMTNDTMIYCRANHHFFRINTNSFSVEKLDSVYGFASASSEFLDFEFSDMGLLMVIARGGYVKLIHDVEGHQLTLDSVSMKSPFYGHDIFITDAHIIWSSENVGNRVVDRSGKHHPIRLQYPKWACLLVDSKGRMWIDAPGGLEIRYPPYALPGSRIPLASDTNIRSFVESSDGSVWILGSVLLEYTEEESIRDHSYALDALRIKLITNMSEDADHNLWFMTADGILIQFDAENVFRNYFSRPEFSERTEIRNIFQASDGKIYANPANLLKVIYQIDPVTGIEAEIVPKRRDGLSLGSWHYGNSMVYDATLDRHWGIDSENGLCLLELPSGYVDVIRPVNPSPCILTKGGRLLCGNTIKDMTIYDKYTGERKFLALTDPAMDQFLGYINDFFVLRDSTILACTIDGIVQFDMSGRLLNHYSTTTDPALPVNNVLVAATDEEGLIWCGTLGGGLFSLDLDMNSVFTYGLSDGMPDLTIPAVIPIGNTYVVAGTFNGLSLLNRTDGAFTNFYIENGLTHNEFNRYAYCAAADGTIYLGGLNGINAFRPEDLIVPRKRPSVIISRIQKYDGRKDTITACVNPGLMLSPIHLTPDEQWFQVDFGINHYRRPERNVYKYQLEGYHPGWQTLVGKGEVRFEGVPPGTYTLLLKGADANLVWSEETVSIAVVIDQEFYQETWFKVLIALMILGLGFLIFRMRLHQITKINKIRLDLANDLHDEVGGNLTYLQMLLSSLRGKSQHDKELASGLKTVQETSAVLRDVVWAIDTDRHDLQDFIGRMQDTLFELLTDTSFTYKFDRARVRNQIQLDPTIKQNMFLIFKEAIHNVVKHSTGDTVHVSLALQGRYLSLAIHDNGPCQAPPPGTRGQGLKSMSTRAKKMGAELNIDFAESGCLIRCRCRLS